MRKFGSNNKLHTAGLYMKLAYIALLSALWGCSDQEGEAPVKDTDEPIEVSLIINAQEITNTRAADADISLIKSIRIYAYDNAGEKVGYYYVGELKETGSSYYIPLRLSKGGQLTFYVIANEKCAKLYNVRQTPGQGKGAALGEKVELSESTTLNDLYIYCFKTEEVDTAGEGYLMTGSTTAIITNQSGTPTVIECNLERDLSELNIAFAKSGNFETIITSVKLVDYTLLGWMYGDHPTWERQFNTTGTEMMPAPLTVLDIVSETDQKDAAKYGGTDLMRPLSYNPDGNFFTDNYDWSIPPETDIKPRLEIRYTQDGVEKNGIIYLPQIGRNIRFNVYCLIKSTGIAMQLQVKEWVENKTEIEWSDNYDFEFNPGKEPVGNGNENFYPIYYTENSDPHGTNDFLVTFLLKGPLGTNWVASLDNKQDFYFADEYGEELTGAPKGTAPTSENVTPEPVTIRLRARSAYDENIPKKVKMTIRVQTAQNEWTRLIINDKLTTGTERDAILIKQLAK